MEKKKKILIIEDEPDMIAMLRTRLEAHNFDVLVANDGQEGFDMYMNHSPDLIILDIMLPKLNGYEVCRKIRRDRDDSSTPIMMLSAKNQDIDRIVGRVIGAETYLTKPFCAEELMNNIEKLLDQ